MNNRLRYLNILFALKLKQTLKKKNLISQQKSFWQEYGTTLVTSTSYQH